MKSRFLVLLVTVLLYYVISFAINMIHTITDPAGVRAFSTIALIVNGIYNFVLFIGCGFVANMMYKGKEPNTGTIVGLTLVVVNFLVFIIFPSEQPLVLRLMKVVLPLHGAMVGGGLYRRYIRINRAKRIKKVKVTV